MSIDNVGKSAFLAVRLTPAVKARLEDSAWRKRTSSAVVVRGLIEEYLRKEREGQAQTFNKNESH